MVQKWLKSPFWVIIQPFYVENANFDNFRIKIRGKKTQKVTIFSQKWPFFIIKGRFWLKWKRNWDRVFTIFVENCPKFQFWDESRAQFWRILVRKHPFYTLFTTNGFKSAHFRLIFDWKRPFLMLELQIVLVKWASFDIILSENAVIFWGSKSA